MNHLHIHTHPVPDSQSSMVPLPPPSSLQGWHDTINPKPNDQAVLAVLFNSDAMGIFMYHCHILGARRWRYDGTVQDRVATNEVTSRHFPSGISHCPYPTPSIVHLADKYIAIRVDFLANMTWP